MNLIEIFHAGKQVDRHGKEITFTQDDLQQVVDSYDVAFHESPVVVGHPQHNHPAYAWVKSLQLDGDVLKAEFDQIDPEFAEMVETGRFKKVSASFYSPNSPNNPKKGSWYLRHVGFLGAMPPAVKGLRNPEFAEDEEGVFDFSEFGQANLFARMREWLISKFGLDEADKALPPHEVEWLKEDAMRGMLKPDAEPSFNEPSPPPNEGEPEMSAEDKAELERLKAENEALKNAQAKAEAEKAEAELKQTQAENAEFAEGLVKAGKLAPIAKASAVDLLNFAAIQSAGGVLEFNEGESLLSKTKAFLDAQPQVLEFAEFATKDKASDGIDDTVEYSETDDPKRIELDRKVRAYMKAHNVDYATALSAVA
ncbi:peptidase [Actinobacillus equuli]|uniref:peptidase n=1 Tax=Actinobacillus equuli TaxID=718 RepID=UPI0024423212|nr:peptidase [Actinobacillus equuli]WGE52383.1 peptidase [Actinobacillus equuli subsp. haemolyticus]